MFFLYAKHGGILFNTRCHLHPEIICEFVTSAQPADSMTAGSYF